MSEFTRVIKHPFGIARLVTNYSRIKELQEHGLSVENIAQIFDQDAEKLSNFVEMADSFVSGKNSLSLDVTVNSKKAFEETAKALS